MRIGANQFLGAIAVGIGASLGMDLWNLFLKRAFSAAWRRRLMPLAAGVLDRQVWFAWRAGACR